MTTRPEASHTSPKGAQLAQEDARALPAGEQSRNERGPAWYLSPLWLCLLVAVLIRVWLTIRTHGTLDGDEALLGIQAEHILGGEHPIYFYGIPYFGSLEAYVAAALFAIFGPSVAALRAETTGFALALVAVTWWFASLLAETAQLPRRARLWFTTIAALFAALPPLYDGIILLRTGGGWIESFIIMLLLIVAAYRLTTRRHAGATLGEQAWRWAGIGFLVGFGMWIYPLVTVAIAAAALWIILDRVMEISKRMRDPESITRQRTGESSQSVGWPTRLLFASVQTLKDLPLVLVAIPTCLIGFTPGLIWGASNNWANIRYLFSLGGGWTLQRLNTVAHVSVKYVACVAPHVIGGGTPLEDHLLLLIHAPLVLIGVVCTLGSGVLVVASFRSSHPVLQRARALAALPTLFGACAALLFCTSSASASILISCRDDFGGRYAAPLVLALPFLFATAFTLVYMFLTEKRAGQARSEERETAPVQTSHVERRNRPVLLGVLVLLLVAYFGGQATTYGLTDPDQAFQSAYCTIAPANYTPIIAYMQREGIRYAWATNLLGYQISFETDNAIIMADPLPLVQPGAAINRIPTYTNALSSADRPSLLVFVRHGDPHPYLLQALQSEHVAYRMASFPSQPGVDVLIVTPTSRTVSPLEFSQKDLFTCEIH